MCGRDAKQGTSRKGAKAQRKHQISSAPLRLCEGCSSRRGISLLEVLICTFVLSMGLLGLAALIPLGRLAIVQTAIADRSGACGRAALREVKIRGLLEPGRWLHFDGNSARDLALGRAAFVIDPLFLGNYGNSGPAPPNFGNSSGAMAVLRFTLHSWPNDVPTGQQGTPMSFALADRLFRWQDDVEFDMPDNADERPRAKVDAAGQLECQNNYTWFLTVSPAPAEAPLGADERARYLVSAVVCYKRDLFIDQTDNVAVGEHTATATFIGLGYGGGNLEIQRNAWTTPPDPPERIRDNQWIMLCGGGHALWYRILSVAEDPLTGLIRLTLAGPDWTVDTNGDGNLDDVQVIIVDGVVGVYTTTVER
jgi:hypothetical protein